ncbi:MAG: class I SAM-dependent methyltransferase [Bacteroidota bacterium]
MDIERLLSEIEPSQSDRILHQLGFDLVREYFLIAEHLPMSEGPVLELATGTGRMSAVLASLHPSVITGDISLTDMPRAFARIPAQYRNRVQFQLLDMVKLPFRNDSVKSLVCMNTLHETEHPESCLEEMIRIVDPSGVFIVGDFSRKGFDTMQTIQRTVYHNDHSEGSISTEAIKKILQQHFDSILTFTTNLNITYIASLKRHHSV